MLQGTRRPGRRRHPQWQRQRGRDGMGDPDVASDFCELWVNQCRIQMGYSGNSAAPAQIHAVLERVQGANESSHAEHQIDEEVRWHRNQKHREEARADLRKRNDACSTAVLAWRDQTSGATASKLRFIISPSSGEIERMTTPCAISPHDCIAPRARPRKHNAAMLTRTSTTKIRVCPKLTNLLPRHEISM